MDFLSTGLTALICVAFVFLGRWLYRNPQRVFPRWGLLNPEHPGAQKLGGLYAGLFVFVGTLASLEFVFAFLFPGVPGIALIALPIGAVIAWLLLPKIDSPEHPKGTITSSSQKQRLLTKHWKTSLTIVLGLAAIGIVSVFWSIGDSDACKMAIAAAQSNPIVKQRLGEPIKRGFFISGNIEVSGPSGHADIAIPVSGPRGKATLYAVAEKSAGLWKLESLQAGFSDESARENLLDTRSNSVVQ
jgi:hypothetical protein